MVANIIPMSWRFRLVLRLKIINPDGILHNVHSYSKVNSPFNQAQPKFKKTLEVKIEKPEAVEVKCDVHGWMHGWLVATETPYFAVTDKSGSFKLDRCAGGQLHRRSVA